MNRRDFMKFLGVMPLALKLKPTKYEPVEVAIPHLLKTEEKPQALGSAFFWPPQTETHYVEQVAYPHMSIQAGHPMAHRTLVRLDGEWMGMVHSANTGEGTVTIYPTTSMGVLISEGESGLCLRKLRGKVELWAASWDYPVATAKKRRLPLRGGPGYLTFSDFDRDPTEFAERYA